MSEPLDYQAWLERAGLTWAAENPADPVPAELTDRITELIDRRCPGRAPDCRDIIPEDDPSPDFCSEECARLWRARQVGVGSPVAPGRAADLSSMPSRSYYMPPESLETWVRSARGPALPAVELEPWQLDTMKDARFLRDDDSGQEPVRPYWRESSAVDAHVVSDEAAELLRLAQRPDSEFVSRLISAWHETFTIIRGRDGGTPERDETVLSSRPSETTETG